METKQLNNEEIEIDLFEVLLVLISKAWLILMVGVLTATIGFVYSAFFIAPTFKSTTKIYILNKQKEDVVTYAEMQAGIQLTKDDEELIRSRMVLEKVIQDMGLEDISYEAMLGKVSVTTPEDTRIMSITVTDTEPVLAMEIANKVREVASEHIKNVMDIEAVNVAETANLPTRKAGPNIIKYTMLGGCAGAFFVIAVVLLFFFLDDTIKSSDDVERYLGLSTLALIPLDEQEAARSRKKKHTKKKTKVDTEKVQNK